MGCRQFLYTKRGLYTIEDHQLFNHPYPYEEAFLLEGFFSFSPFDYIENRVLGTMADVFKQAQCHIIRLKKSEV